MDARIYNKLNTVLEECVDSITHSSGAVNRAACGKKHESASTQWLLPITDVKLKAKLIGQKKKRNEI